MNLIATMPLSPTDSSSVITIENSDERIPSVKSLVFRRWLVFLFPIELATKWRITDD
jgi:hypothetical protein